MLVPVSLWVGRAFFIAEFTAGKVLNVLKAARRKLCICEGIFLMENRRRYHWLDNTRGLWLFSMIVYHLFYDLEYIFGFDMDWYKGAVGDAWQQSIIIGFVLIAGISACFSRRPAKRGLMIFGCGLLVSLTTILFIPEEKILFGVLSALGCCYFAVALLQGGLRKIPVLWGAAVSFFLFLLTRTLPKGYLSLGFWHIWELPDWLYSPLGTVFGFPSEAFESADYVPLLPWLFLFIAGYFLGRRLRQKPDFPKGRDLPLLAWAGRHSLLLYMIHQPLIYGALWLIF